MSIKNVLNDIYARDISRKTRAAFNAKAKSGQYLRSKAPFGFQKSPKDKHKLIIDEPAAETVRYIFKLASEGFGYNQIAKTLRDSGILNPNAYFKCLPACSIARTAVHPSPITPEKQAIRLVASTHVCGTKHMENSIVPVTTSDSLLYMILFWMTSERMPAAHPDLRTYSENNYRKLIWKGQRQG